MTKLNVSRITFRNNISEEVRGHSEALLQEGMVIFLWHQKVEALMYPIDTIKSIVSVKEEE